ncbi:hypothetical protein PybrP1_000586 [[Pythium] brassicae (nom. inval.)]|nr:hypothetical protein PybrP1_000586 [[Pythium] brassicae (nom. inval.)]
MAMRDAAHPRADSNANLAAGVHYDASDRRLRSEIEVCDIPFFLHYCILPIPSASHDILPPSLPLSIPPRSPLPFPRSPPNKELFSATSALQHAPPGDSTRAEAAACAPTSRALHDRHAALGARDRRLLEGRTRGPAGGRREHGRRALPAAAQEVYPARQRRCGHCVPGGRGLFDAGPVQVPRGGVDRVLADDLRDARRARVQASGVREAGVRVRAAAVRELLGGADRGDGGRRPLRQEPARARDGHRAQDRADA